MLRYLFNPTRRFVMSQRTPSPPSPREVADSPQAPDAIGPYSQAVMVKDTLYCSGQIPLDPETGSMVAESVEAEAIQVLENIGAVLRYMGMGYEHVVQCTVFLSDINNYATVNDVYGRYFNEQPPAREAIEVAALPRQARVEISCIAVR
jgi:2-iminobutanoate/2-iminopropanoate deaminase